MKKHLVFALIFPVIALIYAPAQQSFGDPGTAVLSEPTLPAASSMTAYSPYWSLGRGYWKGSNLVFIDPSGHSRVDLYDKDSIRNSIKITVTDNAYVELKDAVVASDNRVIVAGVYIPENKKDMHGFVAVADKQGHLSPLVNTGSFYPSRIDTCDSETVWALGRWRDSWNPATRSHDPYDALRQFRLSDGKMLAKLLSTASSPRGPDFAVAGFETPDLFIQCRNTKLGMYFGSSDEWIEYDTATDRLDRWKLPHNFQNWISRGDNGVEAEVPALTGLAMLDSGEVYASFDHHDPNHPITLTRGLYRLEKSGDKGTWLLVSGTEGNGQKDTFRALEGTDGKNLVYSKQGEQYWYFSSAPQ